MAYERITLKRETSSCLLCHEAPCSAACPKKIPVDKVIRSIRFDNTKGARKLLSQHEECASCEAPCMTACNRNKMGKAVDIKEIMRLCKETEMPVDGTDVDLSIDFCGVSCENPFLLSSSVVCNNYEMVAKAFDMGWGGVAFKTIANFLPEEVSPRFAALEKEDNPFVGFKNIEQLSDHTLEENMGYISKLKQDYPTKIILASIMGRDEEEWTYLAQKMEEAGADIIECNFSCPHMSGNGLGSDVGTDPELVKKYTIATKKGTSLPVIAKMTPNITNMEIPAIAAVEAGAVGIAAINTIKSVMNVDLHSFVSEPNVDGKSAPGGYSGKAIKPIALRFISDMKQNKALADVPMTGMGGIETWRDAAEYIALGCETVQVTTAIMQYGYRIIDDLIDGLKTYMAESGIQHVADIVGKGLEQLRPTDQLNRVTIEYPRFNRDLCVGCQRCYISCYDGGHQAIRIDEKTGKPVMDGKKCVGCQLCRLVCPAGAITAGVRKTIAQN